MSTSNTDLVLGDVPAFGIHDGARIVECSPELAEMFGYASPALIVGQPSIDFIDPEYRNQSLLEVMNSSNGPYDSVGIRADGTRFRIQISAHNVQHEGQECRLFFVRDLSPRALVVDDDDLIRNMVCLFCHNAGYRPLMANSAESALRIFRAGAFAVIVTDILMPGMSGKELATQLRAADRSVPIVFMSGSEEMPALDANSRFIAKPFTADDFADALGAILG